MDPFAESDIRPSPNLPVPRISRLAVVSFLLSLLLWAGGGLLALIYLLPPQWAHGLGGFFWIALLVSGVHWWAEAVGTVGLFGAIGGIIAFLDIRRKQALYGRRLALAGAMLNTAVVISAAIIFCRVHSYAKP